MEIARLEIAVFSHEFDFVRVKTGNVIITSTNKIMRISL